MRPHRSPPHHRASLHTHTFHFQCVFFAAASFLNSDLLELVLVLVNLASIGVICLVFCFSLAESVVKGFGLPAVNQVPSLRIDPHVPDSLSPT